MRKSTIVDVNFTELLSGLGIIQVNMHAISFTLVKGAVKELELFGIQALDSVAADPHRDK